MAAGGRDRSGTAGDDPIAGGRPVARGTRRAGYSAVPKSQRASRPGLEPGADQPGGLVQVGEDLLGGQVSAADRPFHRGRPAGVGPVAGQEQAVDRRPLRGPKRLDSRPDRERRPVLGHDPPSHELRRSGRGPDLGQLAEHRVPDRDLVERQQVVRGADDQLQILALAGRSGSQLARSAGLRRRPARSGPGSPCG